jgi:hypothetical protein
MSSAFFGYVNDRYVKLKLVGIILPFLASFLPGCSTGNTRSNHRSTSNQIH